MNQQQNSTKCTFPRFPDCDPHDLSRLLSSFLYFIYIWTILWFVFHSKAVFFSFKAASTHCMNQQQNSTKWTFPPFPDCSPHTLSWLLYLHLTYTFVFLFFLSNNIFFLFVKPYQFSAWISMTVSTEHNPLPQSAESIDSKFLVRIQIGPNLWVEPVPRDIKESEFPDLVDIRGFRFQWKLS